MTAWALDLGTTNSLVARWDEPTGRPQIIELPAVCRMPHADDSLEAPRMVPSAVHLLDERGLLAQIGAWPPVARRVFLGRRAIIGQPALERNVGTAHPSFVPSFKAALASESLRPLGRVGRRPVSAREVAQAFLRELLVEVKRTTRQRIRDLVVTIPVTAFEPYRAELTRLLRDLGVRRVRFVDEPIAAALGYGVSLSHRQTVLVVDIGGGTMQVVLVAITARDAAGGQARVIAKRGLPLGGNAVDGWVLEESCRQAGYQIGDGEDDDALFWRRQMLAEARRVKEALHFEEEAIFRITPPGFGGLSGRGQHPAERQRRGLLPTFTRAQLSEVLERNGFYRGLEESLAAMFESGEAKAGDVDEVLLVGGSTLLPGVFSRLEQRFERRRLRAWQPFEAVAYGGACFAADRVSLLDFIIHDYAFVTHDATTGKEIHTIIVPRGTRFPTPPDLWKRQLVPTCALGDPETLFRLVICEVATSDGGGERRFVYDGAGRLHKVGGERGDEKVVVPLNASSPTLGSLDPPHRPGDRRPRLEIGFGVNADRWLVGTVYDLLTRKLLMREEPVVRLL